MISFTKNGADYSRSQLKNKAGSWFDNCFVTGLSVLRLGAIRNGRSCLLPPGANSNAGIQKNLMTTRVYRQMAGAFVLLAALSTTPGLFGQTPVPGPQDTVLLSLAGTVDIAPAGAKPLMARKGEND